MAQLPIKKGTDGILRQRAKPVPKVTKKINKLLKDMLHTMYSAQGVGLAAPQVGKNLRLVVVDVGEGPLCLVNPVLDQFEGTQLDQEGCLSLPGVVGDVRRAAKVRVEALTKRQAGALYCRAYWYLLAARSGSPDGSCYRQSN